MEEATFFTKINNNKQINDSIFCDLAVKDLSNPDRYIY